MGTVRESRAAAGTAVATAMLLAGALLTAGGGPSSGAGEDVIKWFAQNPIQARLAALLWLGAMLMWVAFAVRFHDAVWLSVADRAWATSLFLQGAVVFSTIVTISAAGVWALSSQVTGRSADPATAAALWSLNVAMLRFAAVGLCVPVAVVSLALRHRSRLGRFTAASSVLVGIGLLVPWSLSWGLYAFTGWLVLVSATMFQGGAARSEHVFAAEGQVPPSG